MKKMLYLASIDVNLCIKMIEKAQIWQFLHVLTYEWPKYHLLMFLWWFILMVLVLEWLRGLLCDLMLANWCQFEYKMIKKAQICQFLHVLTCGWPKYHLFRFFYSGLYWFWCNRLYFKNFQASMLYMMYIDLIFIV